MMKKKVFQKKGKKEAPTTPEPRSGHIFLQSEKDETMYVVGGHTDKGPQCDVWSYTPSNLSWLLLDNEETSELSPLPRFEFDGCIIGSFIYLFGGFQADGDDVSILNDLWAFDLDNQTWNLVSEECSAPERSGHVVVAIDAGRFIVHGGTCMGARNDLWVHSTVTGHWDEIVSPSAPCPRSMHSAVFCKETQTLAVFGGVTQQGNDEDVSPIYLNDLWVMKIGDHTDDWQWRMVQYQGFAPSPRDLPALVSVDGGIIMFGGFGFVEITDDLDSDGEEGAADGQEGTIEPKVEESTEDSLHSDVDLHPTAGGILGAEGIQLDGLSADTTHTSGTVDLRVTGVKKVLFPSDMSDAKEEEGDGDDDSGIAIDYLSDAWYINIATGESTEIELALLAPEGLKIGNTQEEIPTIPRRGCKFLPYTNGKIISFGGFDGEMFFGRTEELNMNLLPGILSEKPIE